MDPLHRPGVTPDIDAWPREIRDLSARLRATADRLDALLARRAQQIREQAAFAGFTGAVLRSDAISLEGPPSRRMQARRVDVGDPVVCPFDPSRGVTTLASTASDVRELWQKLLDVELASDDALRGTPSTVLDLRDASVRIDDARTLHVSLDGPAAFPREPVVAVPRFTHAAPPRKLRNFGHWLLDCLPQVVALRRVAPDAKVLVPGPLKPFQAWSFERIGVPLEQVVVWDGSPLACRRLVVFENDGRTGGGRPLSALAELRRLLDVPERTGTRRVYVSRRDARRRRQWMTNEAAVEEVFRSRGFDVVSMSECPLDEQERMFRAARIVAGGSGAGLTNLIFSAPGTHAIVLISDGLMRWYADQRGARSLWASGTRGGAGHLAALGDSPRFYAHLAAAFGQVCHSFVAADEMPVAPLAGFLDAVLARVDAG